MSATASFSNPEPPPLLFGSPPFSPRSPLHTQTPTSPPPMVAMEEPEDVDMTTSIILPAQNHDRQDDAMQDGGEVDSQVVEGTNSASSGNNRTSESGEGGGEGDSGEAMDTTPDPSPQPELVPSPQPGLVSSLQPDIVPSHDSQSQPQSEQPTSQNNAPSTPAAAAHTTVDSSASQVLPPAATASDAAAAISTEVQEPQSQPPSDPSSTAMPPPPPDNDDSTSVSDDDGVLQWYEVIEDNSVPDELELKEIEEATEHSALDDAYWQKRTFVPLHDPEYIPDAIGNIKWTIEKLNGTREEPNMELMMKSETVKVGNYEFGLTFFPNSCDESQYFSLFLACESMVDPDDDKTDKLGIKKKDKSRSKSKVKDDNVPQVAQSGASPSAIAEESKPEPEWQHTPLPLLEPKQIQKRQSVAVQFSLIVYNPEEPRVHFHMMFSHRFCPGAPDHGSKHFGFRKTEAATRNRGQRQALYRNDKLAFSAHIRLVNDPTGCLWERSSRENPYDSLMITGLQGISSGSLGISGGNIISAISTWLLLMPFRQLLYDAAAPSPVTEPRKRPKPMLVALQKILYCLRTRPTFVGNGPFRLEDLEDAFNWYTLSKSTDKYDTIEIWEIIRAKLEEELADTPFANRLTQIFGPVRNRATGMPSYKVPVRGSETMQKAIDKTEGLLSIESELPQVLTIEQERYIFDEPKRKWLKLSEKVQLDDQVVVCGQEYKLFGFIVHKESAQSGYYNSVLRPDGPDGKWYMYTDSRDNNKVMCLTKKLAIAAHEGTDPKKPNNDQASVAYVVTYVRSDIANQAFKIENEPEWQVPEWIVEEVQREREDAMSDVACGNEFEISVPGEEAVTADVQNAQDSEIVKSEIATYEFEVVSSKIFEQHEGPGTVDIYDEKWANSEYIFQVSLTGDANVIEARNQVAAQIPGVNDPRQGKFWILGSNEGTLWRPNLNTTGNKQVSGGTERFEMDWKVYELVPRAPERRLWLHIIPEEDLPPLPAPAEVHKEAPAEPATPQPQVANGAPTQTTDPEAVISPALPNAEDEYMSGTQDDHAHNPATGLAPVSQVPPIPNHIGTEVYREDNANPSPLVLNVDTLMNDITTMPPINPIPPVPNHLQVPTLPQIDIANGMSATTLVPEHPRAADKVYFFLKTFDPKTQTLKGKGSYYVDQNQRVDNTVYKILNINKSEKTLDIYKEVNIACAQPIRRRRDFNDEGLKNGCIIIAQESLNDDEKAQLFERGLSADPNAYLRALSERRSFPATANGTVKLDYFSGEKFEGEVRDHVPHGNGMKIYHNNDAYKGTFNLGQRHGTGFMTFANGDTYQGEWINGAQHGEGTSIEAETGNKYEGGWRNGKKSGKGVTYWEKADQEMRFCSICWENEAEAVFVDCGHMLACMECARPLRDCPVCRRSIKQVVKLYLP